MLKTLELVGFRNYLKKKVNFVDGVNVIVGDNGIGKTNLLEAIYILASGESFRAKKTEEMINFDLLAANLVGKVSLPDEEVELMVNMIRPEEGVVKMSRKYLVDGAAKRKRDFVGMLPAVVFLPEDLELLNGASDRRRKQMNMVLEQVFPNYAKARALYEQAIRRRNKTLDLIRDGKATRASMLYWDQTVIKNGEHLTQKRIEWVDYVNKIWQQSELFNQLKLVYDKSVISAERLAEYEEKELIVGYTLIGPHKDDWQVTDKGRDLAVYGSRGEQRMAVLAMKAAEIYFLRAEKGMEPILLLDDIFSELDEKHREEVRRAMKGRQVIMTTALREDLEILPEGNVIELETDGV